MSGYGIERLADHDRQAFNSGVEPLDRYFRQQAGQDHRRRVATCFVAIADDNAVAGFYTLAATSLAMDGLALDRARKLPRYPVVPAILLGRLAIDQAHQGRRLGSAMVADALLRARAAEIAGHAMVVDAKDEPAVQFYVHLGFERLKTDPRHLIRSL